MIRHWFGLSLLTVLSMIAVIPILLHQNLFLIRSGSTDAIAHIAVISKIGWGNLLPEMNYIGQMIVGYPMAVIHSLFNIDYDTLFVWLCCFVLVGTMVSLYFLMTKMVNRVAGFWIVLFVPFSVAGFMNLWIVFGVFNIVNMLIILPWAVLMMADWLVNRKRKSMIISLVLFVLFSLFHTTALYLSPAILVFYLVYVAYGLIRKQRVDWVRVSGFCLSVIAINGVLVALLLSRSLTIISMVAGSVASSTSQTIAPSTSFGLFVGYLSPVVFSLLVVSILGLIIYRKKLSVDSKLAVVFMFFGSLIAMLAVVAYLNWSIVPYRSLLDMVLVLTIVIACFWGLLFRVKEFRIMQALACSFVAIASIYPTVTAYLSYYIR